MAEWIFRREQGCCAWLGRGPGKRSERRSRHKAICPNAMRSFWKVAAFRLTDSIRIQSVRRALRCFQNELHHFIILNLKWYYRCDPLGHVREHAPVADLALPCLASLLEFVRHPG